MVVLPAPFGPSSARTSPRGTSRSRPSTARPVGNERRRLRRPDGERIHRPPVRKASSTTATRSGEAAAGVNAGAVTGGAGDRRSGCRRCHRCRARRGRRGLRGRAAPERGGRRSGGGRELHEAVRREHLVADPDDADADVGERRVDDVGVVRRAGDERVHDGRNARPGAHVLAELDPRSGDTGRDRVGVKDLARRRPWSARAGGQAPSAEHRRSAGRRRRWPGSG